MQRLQLSSNNALTLVEKLGWLARLDHCFGWARTMLYKALSK